MVIKILVFFSLLFLQALSQTGQVFAQQDKATSDHGANKVKRINALIELLDEKDPSVRKTAYEELKSIGPEVVPFLEEKLKEKGARQIYDLIKEINQQYPVTVDELKIPLDEGIKEYEKFIKNHKPLAQNEKERYVLGKLTEALLLSKKGDYALAEGILKGLEQMESNSKYIEQIKYLKGYAEQKVLKNSILTAKITTEKKSYKTSDKITFILEIQNLTKNEMKISHIGMQTGKIIAILKISELDPLGDVSVLQHPIEIEVDSGIKLTPEGRWTKEFVVDTSESITKPEFLRTFWVSAYTIPLKIEATEFPCIKRIIFDEIEVKVVPAKYENLLADPLKSLGEVIDKGTVNEVFICAMLVDRDKKDAVIALLIEALKQSKNDVANTVICHILTRVTGQELGANREAWLDWWQKR